MSVLTAKIRRDLTGRRVRTVLTLLGIAVGVAGLVAVSTTARGLASSQRRLVAAEDYPNLSVRTGALAPGFPSLVSRELDGALVEGRTVRETTFSAGGPWHGCVLVGIPGGRPPLLRQPELVAGRWPGPGEIAFDAGIEDLSPVALGDLVAIRVDAGSPIEYLRVVGFTRTPGVFAAGILNQGLAYTDASVVEGMLGRTGPNELLVRLPAGLDPDQAAAALSRLLDRREVAHLAVERTGAEVAGSRELRTVVWLLLAFSVLGLALSGILVANTIAAIVLDETRQIGALKALGASRGRVALVYAELSLALGAVGTAVGFVAGIVLGATILGYLTGLIGYPRVSPLPSPREVGLALLVGLGVPLLASAGPIALATRRPPAELLRTYGLVASAKERRPGRWRLPSPRWALGALAARSALRRRLRAGFTVSLIAVAVAAAIGARSLSASLDGTIDSLYERYGADVWIGVDNPIDEPLARAVSAEPGVAAAERWSRATGYAARRQIDVWGVPATTTIYLPHLTDGRWLRPGEERTAVATSALARRLDVTVGQELRLDVGGTTRVLAVVGVVDDDSTELGSTAAGKLFVAPDALAGTTTGGLDFLAVRLHRHDPQSVEQAIAVLETRLAPLHPAPYATYGDRASTARSVAVVTILLRAMVVLLGLTGLVGVVNTVAISLAERRQEIGVLRALGARRPHLAILAAGEAMVLGGLGFAFGLVVGLPLAVVLVRATGRILFRLDFALPPTFPVAVLVATLAACALAALGPAFAAARTRPSEVLRYE
jgi:putative ABC transport system permease protein